MRHAPVRQTVYSQPSPAGPRQAFEPAERDVVDIATPRRPADPRHSDAPDVFQPLIDPALVATTVWKWRMPIAALTGLGLLLGVAVALTTPHEYTAYSQILVDPREVKLVGRDITPDYLANEAALAIIDSRLELIRSPAVLNKVVERAELDQDPEFNGEGESFGIVQSLRNVMSIFSGGNGADERDRSAVQTLRDSLWAERAARTFVINVGVTTEDPDKSAMIANELTEAFVEEQERLRSETARSASTALTGRLEALRADVEEAENALEAYRAETGLVGPAGRLVTDDQLTAVTGQLAQARAETIAAKSRAEAAKSIDLDTVVDGGLPQDLTSPALVQLRAQYASQRQQVASLENSLGSRHPRLADAKAALQSLAGEIGAELRRIVAGTQADFRRAVENEQALAGALAELKAASVNDGDAAVGLRELQREVTAAREVYEAFLLRARETGELEAVGTTNTRIISAAEAPDSPSSLSRKLIVAGYGAAGFALGVALAILAALREMIVGPSRREDDRPDPYAPRRRYAAEPATDAPPPPMSREPMREAVPMARGGEPEYPDLRDEEAFFGGPPRQPQPSARPAPDAAEEEELEDIRQSVREIRETVEALMRRRAGRNSRVA